MQGPSATASGLPLVPPMVPITPANPQAAAVPGVPAPQATAPPAPALPPTADVLRPAPFASPGALSVSLTPQPHTHLGRCHDMLENTPCNLNLESGKMLAVHDHVHDSRKTALGRRKIVKNLQ